MEKDLKAFLKTLLADFDADSCNEYFANDFFDDYSLFERDSNNIMALEYLNDRAYEIDTEDLNLKNLSIQLRDMIKHALELIK